MSTSTGHSQSLFPELGATVNYTHYGKLWPCAAALSRGVRTATVNSPVWKDTVPVGTIDDSATYVPYLRPVATQCISDPLTYLYDPLWVGSVARLILSTYDTSAIFGFLDTLMNLPARFQESPDIANRRAAGIVDAAISALSGWAAVVPFIIPIDKIQRLVDQYPRKDLELWGAYLGSLGSRGGAFDSLAIEVGRKIETRVQRMVEVEGLGALGTAPEGRIRDGSAVRVAILRGILAANDRMLNDSLRLCGIECYLKLWRHVYRFAVQGGWIDDGGTSSGLDGVGFAAAPIKPLDWYPAPPQSAVPARKMISLLVFVDSRQYRQSTRNVEDFGRYALIRRIKAAYPEIDITVVTRTLGYFGALPPLGARDEGKAIAQWLLEHHKLPVRVAVDSTPFFFLPEPDNRRVNEESEIDQAYHLGAAMRRLEDGTLDALSYSGRGSHTPVVLIGREGVSVWMGPLNLRTERTLMGRLEAMSNTRTTPTTKSMMQPDHQSRE